MKARTCLVTGASRGLGASIAEQLLTHGHKVLGTWRTEPGHLLELEQRYPATCKSLRLDQSSRASVDALLSQAHHPWGAVEVLVNNAAMSDERPFEQLDDDAWLHMLQTNLLGPVRLIRGLLPGMREARWGRIFNISSIGGQWGGLRQVHYAASKAALVNLTRSLAKTYASEGIVSVCLAPGLFATDMTATELQSDAGKAKVASIPTGRLGRGDELGQLVAALLGPAGDYLAGQTINLNGGMYFQT